MAKKRFDMRLAVGSANGPRSSEWAIWSKKSDLYIAHRSLGGFHKYSFHPPNVCRYALTKEYTNRIGRVGRNADQWLRDLAPEEGQQQVVRVMRIGFSTDYLSTSLSDSTSEKCIWIQPAPQGGSTGVDIMFTRESKENLQKQIDSEPDSLDHKLIAYCKMENGEAFAVTSFHSLEGYDPIRVGAAKHDPFDILALPVDDLKTGRPIRLTLFKKPDDYHYLQVWELGCFRHAPLTEEAWQAMSELHIKKTSGHD
jgi:hypothetical protein